MARFEQTQSLRRVFIALFALFVLGSCIFISMVAMTSLISTGESLAKSQGKAVVEKTKSAIDVDKFAKLCVTLDDSDPYYEELADMLSEMGQVAGAKYLYTMTPKPGSNSYYYVADGVCRPEIENDPSLIGDEEAMKGWGSAPREAYKTGEFRTSGLQNQEDWGWTVSAFVGIQDSSGNTIGIVGCDFDAEFIAHTMERNAILIIAVCVLCIAVGVLIIVYFTKTIFGSMIEITLAMESISRGSADLNARIPVSRKDEIGSLAAGCNAVIDRLADFFHKLKHETAVLSETGEELYNDMAESVARIDVAAEAVTGIDTVIETQLEQISTVVKGVTTMENEISMIDGKIEDQTQEIADSSSAVEQISANIKSIETSLQKIADQYKTLIEDSENGQTTQKAVNEQIAQIAQQSKNLTKANAAIANISNQTNLLAMNAAIEAAHAGEAGQGFSVVATEIRALAETSAKQTRAIKDLLQGISTSIAEIVKSSKVSLTAFTNVGQKIAGIDNLIQEVKNGMAEESEGVDSILRAMRALTDTATAITKTSSDMKDTARAVTNQAKQLEETADETKKQSATMSHNMNDLKRSAQSITEANEKNRESTRNVVLMIDGYKVH